MMARKKKAEQAPTILPGQVTFFPAGEPLEADGTPAPADQAPEPTQEGTPGKVESDPKLENHPDDQQAPGTTDTEGLSEEFTIQTASTDQNPPKLTTQAEKGNAFFKSFAEGLTYRNGRWQRNGEEVAESSIRDSLRERLSDFKKLKFVYSSLIDYVQAHQPRNPYKVSTYDKIDETEPDRYLFYPYFPIGVVEVVADSGIGKSSFLYLLEGLVMAGKPLWDMGTIITPSGITPLYSTDCREPGNVMYLTTEDTEKAVKRSILKAAGQNPKGKLIRLGDEDTPIEDTLKDFYIDDPFLPEILKQNQIKLLVIDPLQSYIRNDLNKATDIRPQMNALTRAAREAGTCIVIVRHVNKDQKQALIHRGLGSVDIRAAVRSSLTIVRNPDDPTENIVLHTKHNDTAEGLAIRYRITGDDQHKGLAEITHMDKYSESDYNAALRKTILQASIDKSAPEEPMLIIARQILKQNPKGVTIGYGDYKALYEEVVGRVYPPDARSIKRTVSRLADYAKDQLNIMIGTGVQSSIHPFRWQGSEREPTAQKDYQLHIFPRIRPTDDEKDDDPKEEG